jgi:N-acetylglucosaminyldiphosphoundecaprenol N-acetyl-beta-D-mannosaminyltransferase
MTRLRILNSEFDAVTLEDTVAWACEWIDAGRRGYLVTVNVAILMMMRSDPMLQRFVDHAARIVADGQPLVWVSRLRGVKLPHRVAGVELVDALCRAVAERGYRVYFMGARPEVVETAVRTLTERYPSLAVAGFDDGYFGDDEVPSRLKAIRASGAQLLFLGMGVPRQEQFVERYLEQTGVNLAIPVGGSFEVFAGTKKRAPKVLQRAGLEWAYRLYQEPRRLWKRYLVTNSQFLYYVAREQAGQWSPGRAREVGKDGG